MKTSTRFGEYLITGGLLWITLFIYSTILSINLGQHDPDIIGLWQYWLAPFEQMKALMTMIPTAMQSSVGTLLAALAVIFVFCTGLLLDLLSPIFFTPLEMVFFRRWHLGANRGWLDALIEKNADYIKTDYQTYVEGRLFDWRQPFAIFPQRRAYNKLQSFLLAYIMVVSHAAKLDMLEDQISLWHTSRAISTAMLTLAMLMQITPWSTPSLSLSLTLSIIPLLLWSLSVFITLAMFSRVGHSICSIVYNTEKN